MKPLKILKTSRGAFFLRPLESSDEELLLSAWEIAFGKTFPSQLFHWKYFSPPWSPRFLLCISPQGEVCVFYGGQKQKILWDGREYEVIELMDNFSHPAYRDLIGGKGGLFVRVARIYWRTYLKACPFPEEPLPGLRPEVEAVWGIPGKRHFRLGKLLLSYQELPGDVFYAEKRPSLRASTSKPQGEMRSSAQDPYPSLAPLLENPQRVFPSSLVKDDHYFFWRFWKNPQKDYRLFLWRSPGGKPLAAIFLSEEGEKVSLLDLLAAEPRYLWEALKALEAHYPDKVLRVWLGGNFQLRELFLLLGYQKLPEPLGIIPAMKGFTAAFSKISLSFNWVMGDADLF